jgi:ABC-type branched-subunit amino acid transport system ATPase component
MTAHTTSSGGKADGLLVEGLTVRYGGNAAVSDATLSAPAGRATALIGPNGAGKTTIFNACSGLVRASSGRLSLFGEDVTRVSTAGRARRGLGRTFQRMELCDQLSVSENVSLGREARLAGASVLRQVAGRRRERQVVDDALDEVLERCGLVDIREHVAGTLSTGQRRMVELARAMIADFKLLLLDEPSSGLDKQETERVAQILRDLLDDPEVGLLLVEHDISLVRNVCDYVYVLDFGQLISDGPTADVLSSDIVRAAYLGSTEAERGAHA